MEGQLNIFDVDSKKFNQLTPEEEKKVVDNQRIIFKVLKNLNLGNKIEDFYDVGLIALVEAVKNYDESKGSLSNHIYKSVKWKVCNYLAKPKDCLNEATSFTYFEYLLSSNDDNDNIDFYSLKMFESDYDLEKEIETREKIRTVLDLLNNRSLFSEREMNLFCDYFGFQRAALTKYEIADKLKIAPNSVSSYAKKIMTKLQQKITKYYVE